ncbi:potassium channel family protein [Enterococcus plantarum]|uniref:potassium channel family protein n=1 Tax=Enterococcus plantarum TaxID=1077675 RepID=UPI001F5F0730|nr:potassium channel family protein [Enterococcus plantarum]
MTLISGTIFYSWAESLSLFDALYLSFITLTTIGYGDMYPVTAIGKAFTMLYVTVGLGIISLFISKLASAEKARKISKRKDTH